MLVHRSILVASAVFTTVLRGAAAGAGSLGCDPSTVTTTEKSRSASCTFVLDDAEEEGMMGMSSFSFAGVDNSTDEELLVYTKIKATRRTLDNGSDVTWMGSSPGAGFATLVQSPNGGIAGSFRTGVSAFTIMSNEEDAAPGLVRVKETYWVDAMESGTDDTAAGEEENGDSGIAGLGGRSDEAMSPAAMTVVLPQSEDTTVSEGEATGVVAPGRNRNLRTHNNGRDLQSTTTIDVLIVVTNSAMCESANLGPGCDLTDSSRANLENALRVVEAETNAGMQDVGVRAAVRFVQIIYLVAGYDGRPNLATLDDLRRWLRTDSNVAEWRNDAGADLVALITADDPTGSAGGIAYLESPESVTSWSQFQFYAMVCV